MYCTQHLIYWDSGGAALRRGGRLYFGITLRGRSRYSCVPDSAATQRRLAHPSKEGVPFIPATAGRPTTKPPTGRYRRQLKQRLDKAYGRYGQRWQVETVFSMIKRRLASVVHARAYWSQCRERMLLAVTYNLMLL